jgi:hypothetical protein
MLFTKEIFAPIPFAQLHLKKAQDNFLASSLLPLLANVNVGQSHRSASIVATFYFVGLKLFKVFGRFPPASDRPGAPRANRAAVWHAQIAGVRPGAILILIIFPGLGIEAWKGARGSYLDFNRLDQ